MSFGSDTIIVKVQYRWTCLCRKWIKVPFFFFLYGEGKHTSVLFIILCTVTLREHEDRLFKDRTKSRRSVPKYQLFFFYINKITLNRVEPAIFPLATPTEYAIFWVWIIRCLKLVSAKIYNKNILIYFLPCNKVFIKDIFATRFILI